MPVSHVRSDDLPEKPLLALQGGDQGVLHDVLGERGVAQLQRRDAQQIAPMRFELGRECRIGHVASPLEVRARR